MKLKDMNIGFIPDTLKNNPEVSEFIKKWHYSSSIPRGCRYIFTLNYKNKVIGVAMFGIPVGMHCQNYSLFDGQILELKRVCLIDKTPKNSESYFISRALKWFQNDTNIEAILSYADPEYGHKGIIYRATNFNYIGRQKDIQKKIMFSGKSFHIRAAYQRNTEMSDWLMGALEHGFASLVKIKPKHIYIYRFKRTKALFYNEEQNELYIDFKPKNEIDSLISRSI